MNSLNHCAFIGNVGRDIEMRYMPSGDAIASFSIAVGSQWKDKSSGDKQESTEWVNITAFGKLGEICGEYLRKGSQVYISGRMKTEEYEKDGIKRYSTKIIADRMQMLGSKTGGEREPGPSERQAGDGEGPPAQLRAPAKPSGNFADFEDDIPF